VHQLVILSRYARERSAEGQATDARLTSRLGTSIEDLTRIRWGTIHEFKGLEAPAVILTDVDLSKGYRSDLLYVAAFGLPTVSWFSRRVSPDTRPPCTSGAWVTP